MNNEQVKGIKNIATELGLSEEEYEFYGKYMAKLSLSIPQTRKDKKKGKLILVTGISPTSAGEGKTTTVIGLGQALKAMGKSISITLREPSLGPCFGIKGGATGGGKSIVVPSDKIDLFFTGDFPAVSAAHNLLSAMISNHIYHKNPLNIDPKNIQFPRTIDMNDRSLRATITGAGGSDTGPMMLEKYVITPASEIMAILALSKDYPDLINRLSKILVGFTRDKKPVYAKDLHAEGAMAALLRDALMPNLVQTIEGVPAIIHTGPFGNIAHGTSSIVGNNVALSLTDYVVTESGFGSELGAEKFFDLVSKQSGVDLYTVVIVSTIRALKFQAGLKDAKQENLDALKTGLPNLLKHVELVKSFGFDPVVAINEFPSDTEKERKFLAEQLESRNIKYAFSKAFAEGSKGAMELAKKVIESMKDSPVDIQRKYAWDEPVETKIEKIAKLVYGAKDVVYSPQALKDLRLVKSVGAENMPICMAKTQYSFSDDPTALGAPKDFTVTVNSVQISNGAGFLVPQLGNIMTMPGLPTKPAAENVTLTESGEIEGLI